MSTRRASVAERLDHSSGMRPGATSPVETLVAPNGGIVQPIPVALIDPHPENPREDLDLDDDFVASVKSMGVLQAITVVTSQAYWTARGVTDTVDAGRYVVLMGHRRRAAAEKVGLVDVPAVVRDDLAGDDSTVVMLIENLQRKGLSEIEEARGYQRLRELGQDQAAIARKVGRVQSHISKRLSLLRLPADVLNEVAVGKLNVSKAYEMSRYADDPEILKAARRSAPYDTVDDVARGIKAERERDKLIAAKVTALTKATPGLTVLPWPSGGWYSWQQPTGKTASLDQLRNADVKVTDHAAMSCHAVSVGIRNGEPVVVEVCKDAQSHLAARKAAKAKAEQTAKAKAERAREKAEKQTEARLERARAALGARTLTAASKQVATEVLVEFVVDMLEFEEQLALAAQALGIDVEPRDDPDFDAIHRELRERMAKPGGVEKVMLALAVGIGEELTQRSWAPRASDQAIAGPYLRWLQSAGHSLVGRERELIAGAKR